MSKFINHHAGQGWVLDPLRMENWGKRWPMRMWTKRIWEFRLLYPNPLMFLDDDYKVWQVDRHEAETDLGSIPPPLRGWFPQDEFVVSYVYHDSACRHGGLWRASFYNASPRVWSFVPMTRVEADRRLRDQWIPTEVELSGGGKWRRWPVWTGLSIARPFMPALKPD